MTMLFSSFKGTTFVLHFFDVAHHLGCLYYSDAYGD